MPAARRTVLLALPALAATIAATPFAGVAPPPQQQSPIALRHRDAVRRPDLPPIEVQYPTSVDLSVRYVSKDPAGDPTGCGARGEEETIQAEVPAGAAAVLVGGVRYELTQFHFHTPSEHTLDGARAPLEQHFVHLGPNGEPLVIGYFLYGGGRGGTDVDQVLSRLPELPQECGGQAEIAGVNLDAALPRNLTTFRYTGSLTTAPFTEPVLWNVLSHCGQVSTRTLNRFRTVFPEGDSRETQPLNGRTVYLRAQHRR